MPIISTTGRVLAGQGGIQGSLDGEVFPFPSYGGGCWQNPEMALVGLRTDKLATWLPDTIPLEIAPGANDWAANADAWVAWRAGYGVYGTLESRLLGTPGYETPALVRQALSVAGTCGPRAVGLDGTIAFVPDRQFGYGIVLVAPDNSRVDVPGINPTEVQVLGPGVAVWRGGAVGREKLKPSAPDATNVQGHTLHGTEWLLYWSETCGLCLQENGAGDGWVLDTRPLEFNPSCAVVDDDLQIAWSTTQGESAHDIVVCVLTAAGTVGYARRADGWLEETPVWTLIPPAKPPVRPTFRFTHPVMVRPYFAANSGKPDIFTVGQYSEKPALPDPMPVDARLVLVHDSPANWTVPDGLRAYDLPMIEFYLTASESVAMSAARWDWQLRDLLAQWEGDVGVVPMFYCQGGAPPNELWAVETVLQGLTSLSDLVNRSPRVKVIAPFAYNRANGITAHVELQDAFDDVCAAADAVGEPELLPVDDDGGGDIDPPNPAPARFFQVAVPYPRA